MMTMGTSNTLYGKSAGASLDAGSNYNVFAIVTGVSLDALTMNGDHNTAVGLGHTVWSARY